MMTLSFSKMMVAECPYAYKKRYLEGIEPPLGFDGDMGSFLHDTAKEYWAAGGDPAKMSQIVERRLVEHQKMGEEAEEIRRLMSTFAQAFGDLGMIPTGFEEKLAVDKDGNGVPFFSDAALFRGILDLYRMESEEKVLIIDYKYRKTPHTCKDMRRGNQFTGYSLLLHGKYPNIRRFNVGYYYFPLGVVKRDWRTNEEVGAFLERVKQIAFEIETLAEYPAKKCAYCSWCYWKGECFNER